MITNQSLRQRAELALLTQEQGQFVVDLRNELPLPRHDSLDHLRYSSQYDGSGSYYAYENAWGMFSYAPDDRTLLILRKGSPPVELLPQPRLEIATATLHSGYVAIHNNGSSFEIDMPTPERMSYTTLLQVNELLRTEQVPIVVWQLEEAVEDKTPLIRILNDSAVVFASSAIWSPDEQQLVAAQIVTTSHELLKAIKASLANNNTKSYLAVKTPSDNAYLKGARKGYIAVNNNLAQANAEGTVTALLHPLSGDPQAQTSDFFYLVVAPDEGLAQKFIERLDLAIPWPLMPEWAEYLLEAGKAANLVQSLPGSGSDFAAGLRIEKNESRWQQLLTEGLKDRSIRIA